MAGYDPGDNRKYQGRDAGNTDRMSLRSISCYKRPVEVIHEMRGRTIVRLEDSFVI